MIKSMTHNKANLAKIMVATITISSESGRSSFGEKPDLLFARLNDQD